MTTETVPKSRPVPQSERTDAADRRPSLKDALNKAAPIAVIVVLSVVLVLALNAIPIGMGGDAHSAEPGPVEEAGLVQEAEHMEGDEHSQAEHVGEAEHTEGDGHGQAEHVEEAEPTEGDEHSPQQEGGHGHGEAGIGYIGLTSVEHLDPHELEAFTERVQEEAYAKANADKVRFFIFGFLFVLVFLSFARIEGLSDRLSAALDWRTIGIVTGIILVALVIPTGIVITLLYMPTSTGVYGSVEAMTRNAFLAFNRNLHNWSSEVFIFLMLLHTARTVSTRTFLGRRKIIWLTGALLFVIGWLAFLSGSFMRGDQEALEGFEHMMFSFTLVPLGNYIADFFSGEFTVMKLTAFHIGATTLALGILVALHVLMRKVYVHVQRRWRKAVLYSVALTALLVVQSVFVEAPFVRGPAAGPTVSGVEITKPPWPIYFMIAVENVIGATGMVYSLLLFLPLVILPYIVEFLPLAQAKKSRLGEIAFYAGCFFVLAISYWAAAGRIIAHIFM